MSKLPIALMTAGIIGLAASQAMAAEPAADKTFATKAAEGGLAEVTLGQLAEQKASSPQVKQFGQQMVTDHSQANQELKQIAEKQHLTLPTQLNSKDKATEQKLRGLSGAAFDKAYMQDMVQDHQHDIADFQKEAQSGQDPQMKAFAQKYLPVLQKHLQLAEAATPKS
jgi:putative membrane protein